MMIKIVLQYWMFYCLTQVTLPFFTTLDFSHCLILIFLVYTGGICTFLFALASMWSFILYTIHKFLLHIR